MILTILLRLISAKNNTIKNNEMNTQPIAVKFVNWEVDPLDTLKDSRVYGLRLRLNNGDKMSREDKNWLAENLHRNSYFGCAVPLMGYRFDFSDVIHTYLVKQYGQWCEYYAPDKTSLRKTIYGRIQKIIEI